MSLEDYRALLARVDDWYRGVKAAHPVKVPCSRGCRECCLGLFDITLADRDLLREGMASLDAGTRRDIERRAREILARLPELGETLDGWSSRRIDDLCDTLGDVECPVLGREGECRLYSHRPMTCRMSGVPVVDVSGETIYAEGCVRCTLPAKEAPRLDCHRLRRDERKVLRRRYPGSSGITLLIPQAVAPRP